MNGNVVNYSIANGNSSVNGSTTPDQIQALDIWWQIIIAIPVTLLIVVTIGGNVLVWIAIMTVKKLQSQPANLLILSLASSDMLVGVLIMPFSLSYHITGQWMVSEAMCEVWTTCDVMLCSSSILTLCAISIDRYLAITRPFTYSSRRKPRLMFIMIAIIWVTSIIISVTPHFEAIGWKSPQKPGQCEISQELGYQIYATFGAFYLPSAIMLIIYGRIFIISRRIALSEKRSRPSCVQGIKTTELSMDESKQPFRKKKKPLANAAQTSRPSLPRNGGAMPSDINENSQAPTGEKKLKGFRRVSVIFLEKIRFRTGGGSEQKAIRTLGVIMGAFLACWLPFFIIAIIMPICTVSGSQCNIPPDLYITLTWLGYMNSFLNPIIYARFNRDFRVPFKLILTGKCRTINKRMRQEHFTELFASDNLPSMNRRQSSHGADSARAGGSGSITQSDGSHLISPGNKI